MEDNLGGPPAALRNHHGSKPHLFSKTNSFIENGSIVTVFVLI